ncbi:MAG TPA: protein phosphatase 2C domain-containing protein [Gemmatimonadaceae bacterium]|nr:protein phosphatase 2C domain-containing protein [Gemmatimonadaceae bacterium]
MHDETEVVLPALTDDVVAPAAWVEREPDADWCPSSLQPMLDDAFIARHAHEPGVVQHHAAPWRVLGASVRGRSHAHRGEHRDDAIATLAAGDLLLLAVADGAGSSALSRIGAAVTAQLVVSRTAARFAAAAEGTVTERLGTAMAHAVHDAALRLHELAAVADVSPSAFRTTVIVVAISGSVMLVSQVGDGAVLVQRGDGTVQRVGAQRETSWAGEVTCFVPDACAMTQAAALRQLDARDVSLVALMTDGIDDPFHPLEQSGAALVQQWREGTTEPIGTAKQPVTGSVLGDAASLQQWMTFEQRGEVDDRSLLLAWRDGAQA